MAVGNRNLPYFSRQKLQGIVRALNVHVRLLIWNYSGVSAKGTATIAVTATDGTMPTPTRPRKLHLPPDGGEENPSPI